MTTGDPGPVLLEPFPIFNILFGQFGWICIFKFFKSPLGPFRRIASGCDRWSLETGRGEAIMPSRHPTGI